jgi:hypothetical protein
VTPISGSHMPAIWRSTSSRAARAPGSRRRPDQTVLDLSSCSPGRGRPGVVGCSRSDHQVLALSMTDMTKSAASRRRRCG